MDESLSRSLAGRSLLGGRIQVLWRVGAGGMGIVYAAHDRRRGDLVALKTLQALDTAAICAIKSEFRSVDDVVSPHLVKMLELFTDEQRWFFTMELVDGEPFDRWVRPHGRLDIDRLRSCLRQLITALRAIHDASKLHRDLKPSNVLVTPQGKLVVLDFGLMTEVQDGNAGRARSGAHVEGTPAYMAPEQATGHSVTQASDLYAVGVMLFEALTGRLPFEGAAGAVLAAKQHLDAPSPLALRRDAPADLASLCQQLIAREPARRPSAAEVHASITTATSSLDARSPHVRQG